MTGHECERLGESGLYVNHPDKPCPQCAAEDTRRYVIGVNMVGYLPEMEPYGVVGADNAKQAMINELLRDADHAAQIEAMDGETVKADTLSHTAEDLNLSDVSDGWDGYIDQLHYWITPATEDHDELFEDES